MKKLTMADCPKRFATLYPKEVRESMTEEQRRAARIECNAKRDEFINAHIKVMRFEDYRRTRCWVILSRNLKTGQILGEIENSFNMAWSGERVRVIRPYLDARFMKGKTFSRADYNAACAEYIAHYEKRVRAYNAKHSATHEIFIARVGSKNCPVAIDWTSFYNTKNKRNFDYRNLLFTLREK
ncbi:hypothetical protein VPHK567_0387 [Vibrio phage K567]|nr:hypothetical protein MYOV011v1_p0241 [Vibrio phage 6E35.1a]